MKLCLPLFLSAIILWVQESSALPRTGRVRARKSHVMRGFDIFPRKIELHQHCKSSLDCLLFIPHSHCDWNTRTCVCQKYHVPLNNTMCLPPSLLTYGCVMNSQCTVKVPHSVCRDGTCQCQPDHIPLRKDKCLPAAQIDDYCLNDRQCELANPYSYCKYIIPRVYGKCQCPQRYKRTQEGSCKPYLGSECHQHQDCEEVTPNSHCARSGHRAHCECREGYKAAGITCLARDPTPETIYSSSSVLMPNKYNNIPTHTYHHKKYNMTSLGKPCTADEECQLRDPHSTCRDGICDCIADSECGAKSTGCYEDTFQCRSGHCISWYFVCDREQNCPDNSDETECVKYNCPRHAFQCDDGTCLARSMVCNGRWECPDGSDEARCYTGIKCDRNSFRCNNGQCLPLFTFCNAIQDCADGSDESMDVCEYGASCPRDSFQCNNGRCRSSAILCSGFDGCGDESDETRCEICSCRKP